MGCRRKIQPLFGVVSTIRKGLFFTVCRADKKLVFAWAIAFIGMTKAGKTSFYSTSTK